MAILLERSQIGKREDLADLIAVADQKGTPVCSMVAKSKKPTNTLFEWQMDNYPNPVTTPHVDGTDVTPDTNMSAGRVKAQGRVHNFIQDFGVSALAEDLSNVAGVKSEFARSAAKAITVLKRATEAVVCSSGESAADNGSVGYATRGLGKWIQNGAQSDLAVAAAFRTPTAQIYTGAFDDFDEQAFNDLLQARFDTTGESKTLTAVVGSKLKRKISEFANWDPQATATNASLRTYNQDAKSKTIVNTVDIYQGDFGTVEIVPSTWVFYSDDDADLAKEGGFILDMEQVRMRYNSMPEMKELEDRGGGPRGFVRSVCGLEVGNPLGLIKIAPVNAT